MSFILTSKTRAVGNRAPTAPKYNPAHGRSGKVLRLWNMGAGYAQELVHGETYAKGSTHTFPTDGGLSSRVIDNPGTTRLDVTEEVIASAYTFAVWVKFNTVAGGVIGGDATSQDAYMFFVSASNLIYHRVPNQLAGFENTFGTLVTDQWYRFGVRNDRTSGGCDLFVDGIFRESGTANGDGWPSVSVLDAYYGTSFRTDGKFYDAVLVDGMWSDADFAADYNPATRWDLYQQPRRTYFMPGAAAPPPATLTAGTLSLMGVGV